MRSWRPSAPTTSGRSWPAPSRQRKAAAHRGSGAGSFRPFATQVEKVDHSTMRYVRNYGTWNKKDEVTRPDDADTVAYFFCVGMHQVDLIVRSLRSQRTQRRRPRRSGSRPSWSAGTQSLKPSQGQHTRLDTHSSRTSRRRKRTWRLFAGSLQECFFGAMMIQMTT